MIEEKKDGKYLSEEEFNKELEQQVDSVLKIFESYEQNKKKKEEGNER